MEEIEIRDHDGLRGNLESLGPLKDTLELIELLYCPGVEGNFMELSDYPQLVSLKLEGTSVSGDIRHLRPNHFPKVKAKFVLDEGVW
ncbi:hypothetical protein ACHAWF_005120, partial [Thalassiosira exigua]